MRSEGFVKHGDKSKKSGGKWKMGSEVQWSEDLWWNVYIIIDL